MPNKMLIDASHPEETRVVVTRGQKIEEFDFESASRRQLRGNIYLAKVTRVEPSLQAAFIEYGGNRHGFLAFSEIHPDYYQIPVADRIALLEADARAERDQEREEEKPRGGGRRRRGASKRFRNRDETVTADAEPTAAAGEDEAPHDDDAALPGIDGSRPGDDETGATAASSEAEPELPLNASAEPDAETDSGTHEELPESSSASAEPDDRRGDGDPADAVVGETDLDKTDLGEDEETGGPAPDLVARSGDDESDPEGDDEDEDDEELEEHEVVEQVGGDDALEDIPERSRVHRREYKIQEVIKRRQILLVQVVKEERGNKGAALTTYLSLAGRYSVLMPNTGKGGGISRKITNAEDRKRLKEIAQELEVPDGMGIILRTAGASRTKPEIKRDYEYLMRMWESVRELTLKSSAPSLVYEEGSLIKRTIRDLYNKDIDELVVSGEEGYREARDFMRMIMPTHAKAVKPYSEPQPLFASHGVEAQLDAMFSSHVTLKSGGYLVINPTEALVSIDVNSGRSTREHNIEDTALRTNLEASEEIARQLRLRDLAGLIVIDFIDMEEKRNDRAVEKKIKDCLKNDRARIQVGRISPFGLLEMSRQRIRTGVLESSSVPCAHCGGTGFVRSTPSVALQVLRSVEESLLRAASHNLLVRTRTEAAFYILNQKRGHLSEIEARFGVAVAIAADDLLGGTTTFAIERGEIATPVARKAPGTGIRIDTVPSEDELDDIEPIAESEDEEQTIESPASEAARTEEGGGDENGARRKRRRRRRGRGSQREFGSESGESAETGDAAEDDEAETASGDERDDRDDQRSGKAPVADLTGVEVTPLVRAYTDGPSAMHSPATAVQDNEPARPNALIDIEADGPDAASGSATEVAANQPEMAQAPEPKADPEPEPEPVAVVLTPQDPDRPKRGGWWSKAKAALSGS